MNPWYTKTSLDEIKRLFQHLHVSMHFLVWSSVVKRHQNKGVPLALVKQRLQSVQQILLGTTTVIRYAMSTPVHTSPHGLHGSHGMGTVATLIFLCPIEQEYIDPLNTIWSLDRSTRPSDSSPPSKILVLYSQTKPGRFLKLQFFQSIIMSWTRRESFDRSLYSENLPRFHGTLVFWKVQIGYLEVRKPAWVFQPEKFLTVSLVLSSRSQWYLPPEILIQTMAALKSRFSRTPWLNKFRRRPVGSGHPFRDYCSESSFNFDGQCKLPFPWARWSIDYCSCTFKCSCVIYPGSSMRFFWKTWGCRLVTAFSTRVTARSKRTVGA